MEGLLPSTLFNLYGFISRSLPPKELFAIS